MNIRRDQNYQLTLYLFVKLLDQIFSRNNQHTLIAFDLSKLIIHFDNYVIERNKSIREKMKLTFLKNVINAKYVKLNAKQKLTIDRIIDVVDDDNFDVNQLFFLNDFDDTNKIFMQNIVMIKLRARDDIILVVVFFDITITLLNDDQTTHVRFKISFDFDAQTLCNIKKNSNRARLIK